MSVLPKVRTNGRARPNVCQLEVDQQALECQRREKWKEGGRHPAKEDGLVRFDHAASPKLV